MWYVKSRVRGRLYGLNSLWQSTYVTLVSVALHSVINMFDYDFQKSTNDFNLTYSAITSIFLSFILLNSLSL